MHQLPSTSRALRCTPAPWLAIAVLATLPACAMRASTAQPELQPWHRSTPSSRPAAEAPAAARDAATSPTARHAAGTRQVTGAIYYGIPILQKSFFWDGNGETDVAGLGVHVLPYWLDDVALGLGLNATNWFIGGRDAQSLELEGKLRIHPLESLPAFVEGTTGFVYANEQVPPGGTYWNFTFGFGAGFEFPVAQATSLQCGAFYHHSSNALGRDNDRNPSQNEARIWVGFAHDL